MNSIDLFYLEDALVETKETVDECFEYLARFPKQGLALSYLSSIGQRIDTILSFINTPLENNNDNDPNQLSLCFDEPPGDLCPPTPAQRDAANAGRPQWNSR